MPYYQDQMIFFLRYTSIAEFTFRKFFGVYMWYFSAAQEMSTGKYPRFFQRFQMEEGALRVKALKSFRILLMLCGLSATFWDMAHFINQSLVFLFQAEAYYNCWRDSSLKFW